MAAGPLPFHPRNSALSAAFPLQTLPETASPSTLDATMRTWLFAVSQAWAKAPGPHFVALSLQCAASAALGGFARWNAASIGVQAVKQKDKAGRPCVLLARSYSPAKKGRKQMPGRMAEKGGDVFQRMPATVTVVARANGVGLTMST